jgi:hypothetical protein
VADAFFDAEDMADFIALAASAMQERCDLYNTASPRAPVATDVPCMVVATTDPAIRPGGDRGQIVATWRISLPAGTDVAPDWQVRMDPDTASPSLAGRVFTVVGDLAGSYETSRDVIAMEAQ